MAVRRRDVFTICAVVYFKFGITWHLYVALFWKLMIYQTLRDPTGTCIPRGVLPKKRNRILGRKQGWNDIAHL